MSDVRAWWRDRSEAARAGLILSVILVAVFAPFVQDLSAQSAARYAQSAAIVDHGELALDRYEDVLLFDKVERADGTIVGDKSPLQPLLAAPVYGAARLVGAEPATVPRVNGNLGLWAVTMASSLLPFAVLAMVGVRVCSRLVSTRVAVAATVGILTGTLLGVFASQLYGHILAALLGWGCWLVVADRPGVRRAALVGGALAGAAVATEYPMAIVVVVVAGYLVTRRRWSDLGWFVAGGLPFVALLGTWQAALFGSPFQVSYASKAAFDERPAVTGLPDPGTALQVIGGQRGLLLLSPVLAFAVCGLVRLARGQGVVGSTTASSAPAPAWRAHGVVGLVVLAGFFVLQAGWPNPWGGEAPGARYITPALPFLIPGLAAAWRDADPVRRILTRWSQFVTLTAVVADHLVVFGDWPVITQIQSYFDDGPVPTLPTLVFGPTGTVLAMVWVAAMIIAGHRWWRRLDASPPAGGPGAAASSTADGDDAWEPEVVPAR